MYTSSNDLSTLGRAILRSTLLKPAMTRRWMKPFSFTSDPKAMVGMPWGVRRIELAESMFFFLFFSPLFFLSHSSYSFLSLFFFSLLTELDSSYYQFVHTYNKAGNIGSYYALLALLPELDIGYTVLVAGQPPAGLSMDIAEALTNTYLPTLTYVARTQANATFAGQYRYTGNLTTASNSTAYYNSTLGRFPFRHRRQTLNTTTPQRLNSSLLVTVDDQPGLAIHNWFSNGTDMMYISTAAASNVSAEFFDRMRPSVRLYPTGLEDVLPSGRGKRVAFKAVFEDLSLPDKNGTYVTDCATWVGVTSVVYGSRPLDLFIFEMDERGRVVSVENAALRLRLDKL